MVVDSPITDLDAIIGCLAQADGQTTRRRLLAEAGTARTAPEVRALAERIKEEADRARYQDATLSLRWCADIVALGELAALPTVVALGHMAEAAVLYGQGLHREALAHFDLAGQLFRDHGDELGWARTQMGRMAPCVMLGGYDEAIARAHQARAIFQHAGEPLRAANIDDNLALLLEYMNRPAEAIAYNERALAAYLHAGAGYDTVHTLANHARLQWRLGHVQEALRAHEEARLGYLRLEAPVDAAREYRNIGIVHLTLGHYAQAVSVLTAARGDLLAAASPYLAASAGLHLAECYLRLGRYGEAVAIATTVQDELARCEAVVEQVQAYVWQAQGYVGLNQHEPALHALDKAAGLLARTETLAAHGAGLDVSRAQLLLADGHCAEARALLDGAIPVLRDAGLAIETASAQVLHGTALLEAGRVDEARTTAGEVLAVAERAEVDWLAAHALHLRGRAAMAGGDGAGARTALAAAVRRLDRVRTHVAWDDHADFSATATAVYTQAMALALHQQRPAAALRFAERAKSRALADHLRVRIDVRPRAHDERSRLLVAEMERLRERYAWLEAAHSAPADQHIAAVRWSSPQALSVEARDEVARIERRLAEIWRELQAGNPAYRGEAAALDPSAGETDEDVDDDAAALRWAAHLQAELGSTEAAALLQYAALGDDLVLFVVRRGEVQATRLVGALSEVRRLVPLLRLNVERSAAAIGDSRAMQALGANARGILQRLHKVLLAPAATLLDGAERLVVAPHGLTHHVPFHALHDGHSYLLEQHELSYVPCAGLTGHFNERHSLLPAGRREALVLAYSNGHALPHATAEGRAVAATLGGRLFTEDDATLEALRRHAGACGVLHLATHALFRPDEPLFSALQLRDGRLSTLEVFDLEMTCSLATLSACETALGVTGAGDELMGLSRAFLYAGAPSLVLSLWKVEDHSTAALMEVFYEALRQGAGKAAALRHAQLAVLHHEVGGDADLSAPFFWAPFHLIGHSGPL